MPSASPAKRSQNNARDEVLSQLKDDHKRVKKAYKEFQKLDVQEEPQECESIVHEVLDELTLHAALEEEFLYPAVKELIEDPDLVDEAEVEHESMHTMIDQLRDMGAADEKYAARFTVLCEYVLHHVKEEEGEMFPQLERVKLDWEAIAQDMEQRRMDAEGQDDAGEGQTRDDEAAVGSDDGQAMPRDGNGTGRERSTRTKQQGTGR